MIGMRSNYIIVTVCLLVLSFVSTSLAAIDDDIVKILKRGPANVSGFKGATVVNTQSGEMISSYFLDKKAAEKKQEIAAVVANIVQEVQKDNKARGFKPMWMGMFLRNNAGRFFILFIDQDTYLGCLYATESPLGLIKRQLRKSKKALIKVL